LVYFYVIRVNIKEQYLKKVKIKVIKVERFRVDRTKE
jgi:hypothetical protein